MTTSLFERFTSTPEGMRVFQQERAMQEFTDIVCDIMEHENVSRAELARRLGKTKSYITQLLDGQHNLTIRTISDVFTALDRAVHFSEGRLAVGTPEPAEETWVIRLSDQARSPWNTPQEISPLTGKGNAPQRLTA